jgi:hypothetical protein
MNDLVELSYDKCLELLSGGVVGRVGICVDSIPRIIPVNFAVLDNSIIFRTAPYTVLGSLAWNRNLAFEIDQLDYEGHKGWSVVATGRGEMIEDERELATIRSFWDPRPWAGGSRLLYIRLRWEALTGRRIGNYWPLNEEMPFRRNLGL